MPSYIVRIRATDETGAYADRNFTFNVTSSVANQIMAVDGIGGYASPDGVAWTKRITVGGRRVTHGNGLWIISGAVTGRTANQFHWSNDAVSWDMRTIPALLVDGTPSDPFWAYLHDQWWVHGAVAANQTGWITSINPQSKIWTAKAVTGGLGLRATTLASDGSNIITAYEGSTTLHVSTDGGMTFEPLLGSPVLPEASGATVTYLNGTWLCVTPTEVHISRDLLTWTIGALPTLPANTVLTQITYGNGRMVLPLSKVSAEVGTVGACLTSDNGGYSWSLRSFEPFIEDSVSTCRTSVAFACGWWLLAGSSATSPGLRVSRNAIDWSVAAVEGSGGSFNSIARTSMG